MTTILAPATLPLVVEIPSWLIREALENDSPIEWCETCECWLTYGEDGYVTCFCN